MSLLRSHYEPYHVSKGRLSRTSVQDTDAVSINSLPESKAESSYLGPCPVPCLGCSVELVMENRDRMVDQCVHESAFKPPTAERKKKEGWSTKVFS